MPRKFFTKGMVRELTESYAVSSLGLSSPVDLVKARKQHEAYKSALEKAGLDLTTVKGDERYPDCVFIEDSSVVIGDRVLITSPGHDTRTGEVEAVRPVYESKGMVLMEAGNPEARFDGGDVLFTGKEILCGISCRTNRAGLETIRAAFPEYDVVPVPVEGPLHLKTSIGLAFEDTLCVSTETPGSGNMYEAIRLASKIQYRKIEVSSDLAANCIWINDCLLCKKEQSNEFEEELERIGAGLNVIPLDISEFEKATGSLTCLSVRFLPTGKIRGYAKDTGVKAA